MATRKCTKCGIGERVRDKTRCQLKSLRAETHCAYCQQPLDDDAHLDHVMPLSKGGTHSADNLVMACGPCNRAKRDTLPLQWMLRGSLHSPF